MPPHERPREKALRYGIESLSDSELLAILLRTGNLEKSVLELAIEMLIEFGGIANIFKRTSSELMKINGINEVKALEITAVRELYNRIGNSLDCCSENANFKNIEDVYNYVHPKVETLTNEQLMIFYLNNRNGVIFEQVLTKGTDTMTLGNDKFVCKTAIEQYANKVIAVHNHPDGNSSPSISDIEAFYRLRNALKIIDVKFLDHVIIGNNEYYSLMKETKFKVE